MAFDRQRLEAEITRQKYGNAELARRAGMTPQQLSNVLGMSNPRVWTLQRIARALHVHVDDLLNEEPPKASHK